MDRKELLDIVKRELEDVSTFALMTLESGYPVARPMSGLIFHCDKTILLSTSKNSRKFQQIAKQPTATLFMHEESRYLNIRGKPSMNSDAELKDKYWSDKWLEYYPDGKESDEYVFFCLEIEHISYKDFAKNIDVEMDWGES